jgi:hypothetical protein
MEFLPMCDADEFIGGISAAGAENTRVISAVKFQEFLDRRILLHFLYRLPACGRYGCCSIV